MTGKQLEITDIETGTSAKIDLLWDTAPRTSQFMWGLLDAPIRASACHSSLAGRAVVIDIPEENRVGNGLDLAPENETVTPLPGEIGLAIYPAHAFEDPQRPDEKDGSTPYWQLTIVYGRDCRFFTLLGWEPVTIFAQLGEGRDEFFKKCERIRSDGAKEFYIRRIEGSPTDSDPQE